MVPSPGCCSPYMLVLTAQRDSRAFDERAVSLEGHRRYLSVTVGLPIPDARLRRSRRSPGPVPAGDRQAQQLRTVEQLQRVAPLVPDAIG